jgi:pyruvate-ferredoxin/flavodoxin oxidoreductase
MTRPRITIDGNEAVASVAHRTNEVIAIYPITPSSNMGEWADEWSAKGKKNIWGTIPTVTEMQSEGGAAGAVHGALQAGALTTTFTASQGLLLMIPNMFKIAGELTSFCMHVSARTVATHALSIFGDHSDVMACRQTGFAMLASGSVQEAHDFAAIGQRATLRSRVPVLHYFDGFRTSHEVAKIEQLADEDLRAMITEDLVAAHRARALSPEAPVLRGTAQNPDAFFQAREACNPFYAATPAAFQEAMDAFAKIVGRQYKLFDYVGHPEAERVIVMMGSGAEVTHELVEWMVARGEKVGLVKVRVYRPFSAGHFLAALPASVKGIAVLDRTKEPGALGEPLYLDVVTALAEAGRHIRTVGGRYGLSSKEYTPAHAKAVFDNLSAPTPQNHFTVGIVDDVTHLSLPVDHEFDIEPDDVVRGVFFGLGADGTVGANKNTIKIIGEETENYGNGYFVYDSKKSGAVTISHLRFGPRPIRSSYLVKRANFVACHQYVFLDKYDVLAYAGPGAVFLLNSPFPADQAWDDLPREVQEQIIEKKLRFYVIDAYKVAKDNNMGVRINTIMQVGFFALSGVLPKDEAIAKIKESIRKTYGKRGEAVVKMNFAAVDAAMNHIHEVKVPGKVTSTVKMRPPVPEEAPEFVRNVLGKMVAGYGDNLPVSAFPADGTYPTATTRWERRNIALDVPVWEPDLCIQCGKCIMVCPHAVLRAKVYGEGDLKGAPSTFKSTNARWKELPNKKYTLQLSIDDCTGCALCVEMCPAKDKSQVGRKAINMAPETPLRAQERQNWEFFKNLPDVVRGAESGNGGLKFKQPKDVQLLAPFFEFSSACAGCGETPYLRLMSQLFGDRAIIGNATGCSSIYGGNQPTTPWTVNREGRGPSWNNSLFEDTAEFGFGIRLAVDKQKEYARELVARLREGIGSEFADGVLGADQSSEEGIVAQRRRVDELKTKLKASKDPAAKALLAVADYLVKKSVWSIGGDGWAYDIGYGGLDHVIANTRDINLLVLDTEVYSNTGGQSSKSTPLGAVAKFAAGGKPVPKKRLGLLAVMYGHVYVAQVAMGANEGQTLRAFLEAESYDGPSLIIAYSHCIAHGIDMAKGMDQQRLAVDTGYWPLYRYDPRLRAEGKNPLQLDSKPPKAPLQDYVYNENRYRMLVKSNPAVAAELLTHAEEAVREHWNILERLARGDVAVNGAGKEEIVGAATGKPQNKEN